MLDESFLIEKVTHMVSSKGAKCCQASPHLQANVNLSTSPR